MNTARTARGNRLGLALTGLVLLIGGGYLITRSLGAFGSRQAQDPIYSAGTAGWIHDQRPWFWVVLTAYAVILAALLIRWLLAQLRSDSLNRIALDTDTDTSTGRGSGSGSGSGRAGLPAAALTAAVGAEIDSYPGVSKVRASLAGRPDRPELRLRVTIDPDADLARVRRRITGQALADARTALDTEHLPTQLRLTVGRRARPKRHEI
jgi:hypothetical protein